MSIITDQILYSYIRKLGFILLGVSLMYFVKAFRLTWKIMKMEE